MLQVLSPSIRPRGHRTHLTGDLWAAIPTITAPATSFVNGDTSAWFTPVGVAAAHRDKKRCWIKPGLALLVELLAALHHRLCCGFWHRPVNQATLTIALTLASCDLLDFIPAMRPKLLRALLACT
jgi:hypothetical protein